VKIKQTEIWGLSFRLVWRKSLRLYCHFADASGNARVL